VNGQTTNYTLDLNAGLTQVLNDGTNAYVYGLGRIAQVNTVTEYFLGDALGSVRQLVNSGGTVTLAKSYAPYGETRSSAGSGTSIYSFTGEQQDASGLTYLRSRYYSNGTGRFLTRDTWGGDANSSITLNKWVYASANPINFTDPTGNCSWTYKNRIKTAEENVLPVAYDALTTYTAAGIAVQCWGTVADINPGYYNGAGIAQISEAQAETAYGVAVEDSEGEVRGFGVRCYIPLFRDPRSRGIPCPVCLTPNEIKKIKDFDKKYKLEPVHDPVDESAWAVTYMRRRIRQVLAHCDGGKISCSKTDKFIIAGLAQMGSGFNSLAMLDIKKDYLSRDKTVDWKLFFSRQGNVDELKNNLRLFTDFAYILYDDGYYLPNEVFEDQNKMYIDDLINGRYSK
jgi:RHS repeat-associated protein